MNKKADLSHEEKLTKISQAYSSAPWWYDLRGFFILTFCYRSTLWSQVWLFSKNMGVKHLDVAVGTGTLLEIILTWRKLTGAPRSLITAFDYAPRMLQGAIRRFIKTKDIHVEHADVTKLPYISDTYDTANIANAAHCFPDLEQGLREVKRVLKPGGTMACNVLLYPKGHGFLDRIAGGIGNWGIRKGILHRPYTKKEIEETLLKIGFETTYEEVAGNCLSFIARKPQIESEQGRTFAKPISR